MIDSGNSTTTLSVGTWHILVASTEVNKSLGKTNFYCQQPGSHIWLPNPSVHNAQYCANIVCQHPDSHYALNWILVASNSFILGLAYHMDIPQPDDHITVYLDFAPNTIGIGILIHLYVESYSASFACKVFQQKSINIIIYYIYELVYISIVNYQHWIAQYSGRDIQISTVDIVYTGYIYIAYDCLQLWWNTFPLFNQICV